ncbi:MAG TPA: cysteine--tRNA ligase, partial [Verrucomicrobiota bacterium]|nr:cysteine--tRNA ligase [Verrucomicrobiota bacterium]
DWVREQNRLLADGRHTPATAATALAAWRQVAEVFGLAPAAEAGAPAEVLALVEARTVAKQAKDFARADALRGELKALGWAVEDTPKGPRVKRA